MRSAPSTRSDWHLLLVVVVVVVLLLLLLLLVVVLLPLLLVLPTVAAGAVCVDSIRGQKTFLCCSMNALHCSYKSSDR